MSIIAPKEAREIDLIYRLREALGFNQYYPLSHLDGDAKQMRMALLACAPIAFAAIVEEKKDEIGNSDLDDEQPITITLRMTLGIVREARRALFVANIQPQPSAQKPRSVNKCNSCGRMFKDGETCPKGGCLMGGDF